MDNIPPKSPASIHLPQLDMLRAMAALGVLGYHAIVLTYGWSYMTPDQTFVSTFRESHSIYYRLASPLALGWTGVELFFVLSGFCIHLTFARTGVQSSAGEFFSRRFWRIYPAYVVAILAVELCNGGFHRMFWWLEKQTILAHLLMIHNYRNRWFFGISGSFWTLAYEWQYYCIYPLFLVLRKRLGMNWTLGIVTVTGLGTHFVSVAWPVFARLDALFDVLQLYILWCIGAWLAERFVAGNGTLIHPLWVGMVALPMVACGGWYKALCAGVFAASVLDWKIRRPLGSIGRFMIPIGVISYSFYLFHQPLLLAIGPRLIVVNHPAVSLLAVCAATVPATLLTAWISYWAVEVQGIRLGSFLRKRSRQSQSTQRINEPQFSEKVAPRA